MRIILIFILALGCSDPKPSPTNKDWVVALTAIYFNVDDMCVREYGVVSPLAPTYAANLFFAYPDQCENIIIGNSTMDIGRQVPSFYNPARTNNYAIGGNTACDMFLQMSYIKCSPKNVIVASADGNGVLRGISPEVSAKTIKKILDTAKTRWNAKTILVGIHPIQVVAANKRKNAVNALVKPLPDCYIDMVELFGVDENSPPPASFMTDSIHYKEPVYTNLKNKILAQCGVQL